MAHPAKKLATYEDLVALPENVIGEILNGELFTQPRPASPHALASSVLGGELGGPFQRGRSGGPGGWWIIFEPELHLGPQVLVPDLAGWRRERLPEWPNTPALEIAPDWVCEVLSPHTSRTDRMIKLPIYAEVRVQHVWLIDPLQRMLEVFRKHESNWLLMGTYSDEQLVRAEPFDAIELELKALWGQ